MRHKNITKTVKSSGYTILFADRSRDVTEETLQMDGRRVPALSDVFPLGNHSGMCVVVLGVTVSSPALSMSPTQVHHHYKTCFVFAPPFWLRFSRPPLCLTFDCVWVPLVPVGSHALRLCSGPRCTQLESRAKDLPFCPVLLSATLLARLHAEKKQSHSGLFPSSEILNVAFPALFLVILLYSLEDIA